VVGEHPNPLHLSAEEDGSKPLPPNLVERMKQIFSSMLDLVVVGEDLTMSGGLERRWVLSTSKRIYVAEPPNLMSFQEYSSFIRH
jgi:hypothetical protein